METKYYIAGTFSAAILLFAWGALANGMLPIHALKDFKDNGTVVETIRANAPENGVYFSPQGILAAVSIRPDFADKTRSIGPNLVMEFMTDMVAALLLAGIVLRLSTPTVLAGGLLVGVMGLAGAVSSDLSLWNWYGFSAPYTAVAFIDQVVGWFLAGVVLTALKHRFAPYAQGA